MRYLWQQPIRPNVVSPALQFRRYKPLPRGPTMHMRETLGWLRASERRRSITTHWHQPLTVLQVAKRHGLDLDRAGYSLWELRLNELIRCLNAEASSSRVYWLTPLGQRCQARLRREAGKAPLERRVQSDQPSGPAVHDWPLYGWICHRHRTAIVKAMVEPMQPSAIKRRARRQNETLRMSGNNTRDAMKLLLARGVVRRVSVPKERYPRYELTPVGTAIQHLLFGAEAPLR